MITSRLWQDWIGEMILKAMQDEEEWAARLLAVTSPRAWGRVRDEVAQREATFALRRMTTDWSPPHNRTPKSLALESVYEDVIKGFL